MTRTIGGTAGCKCELMLPVLSAEIGAKTFSSVWSRLRLEMWDERLRSQIIQHVRVEHGTLSPKSRLLFSQITATFTT